MRVSPTHVLFSDYRPFAGHIILLCVEFNGSVISWIRTPAHNASVGGHTTSLHLVGLAVDIQFDTHHDQERAIRWAERNGLFYQPKQNLTCHFQPLPPLPKNAP